MAARVAAAQRSIADVAAKSPRKRRMAVRAPSRIQIALAMFLAPDSRSERLAADRGQQPARDILPDLLGCATTAQVASHLIGPNRVDDRGLD